MNKQELIEKLYKLDEVLLLELLELTSQDICDAFLSLIDEKEEWIRKQLDEDF